MLTVAKNLRPGTIFTLGTPEFQNTLTITKNDATELSQRLTNPILKTVHYFNAQTSKLLASAKIDTPGLQYFSQLKKSGAPKLQHETIATIGTPELRHCW